MAPTPVRADGKLHLVYELHVTNFDGPGRKLTLTRLEVLGDRSLAVWTGEELARMIAHPGVSQKSPDARIPGGARAVVFLWVDLDPAVALPHALRHRLTFAIEKVESEKTVEGAAVDVRADSPVVLGPMLRGEGWMAANGPSNSPENGHRRAINTVDGTARIGQRFAIDWIQLGASGGLWSKGPDKNESWYGYRAEVLAVAVAAVADTHDGIPDNEVGARAVPITLETVAGNYVILELGAGRYAVYGHLKPGSVRVKRGDRVQRGQVLGLVGNSGNSDGPHLHFQVCDGPSTLGSEGLPFVLESFDKQGEASLDDDGPRWKPLPGGAERRSGEIPLENVVVRFP
ncbi:MAG TPA: M23 family metallopeptidase [Candidatus Polarisedimenticolaceae bacterium]|nr:M23 family metallopeptidase [Candidatus Polarisedimenticolaceae bacterium]